MTLTLELTPEEETRLRRLADRRGVDVETALRAVIGDLPETEERAQEAPSESGQTWGAQSLARLRAKGVIGLFADRPEDSPELARKFREEAERRGPHPCR